MLLIKDLEVIELNTKDGKLLATISYQNIFQEDNINNGYNIVFDVPVNIRELQRSARGGVLVNQSIREEQNGVALNGEANL